MINSRNSKQIQEVELDTTEFIELGSERAEVVLDALSSKTTREIFVELYNNPSTISKISNEREETLQNIKYHIDKLEEARLIEKESEHYSEKGNKMALYAPTNEAVLLVAGVEEKKQSLKSKLKPLSIPLFAGGLLALLSRSILHQKTETRTVEETTTIEVDSGEENEVSIEGENVSPDTTEPDTNTYTDTITENIEVFTEQFLFIGFSVPADVLIPLLIFTSFVISSVLVIAAQNYLIGK